LNAPVEFHVEDFKLKDWDKEKLKEIFAELEFKTLGRRLLGDEFSIAAAGQ
jgi:DNA polymerase-1